MRLGPGADAAVPGALALLCAGPDRPILRPCPWLELCFARSSLRRAPGLALRMRVCILTMFGLMGRRSKGSGVSTPCNRAMRFTCSRATSARKRPRFGIPDLTTTATAGGGLFALMPDFRRRSHRCRPTTLDSARTANGFTPRGAPAPARRQRWQCRQMRAGPGAQDQMLRAKDLALGARTRPLPAARQGRCTPCR